MFALALRGCAAEAPRCGDHTLPTLLQSRVSTPKANTLAEEKYDSVKYFLRHVSTEEVDWRHSEGQSASLLETKRRQRRVRAEELEAEMALAAEAEAERLAAGQALRAQRAAEREELRAWLEKNGYGGNLNATKKLWMGDCEWTPLHAAVASRDPRIVTLMIQFGGDAAGRNSLGQTAFTLALSMDTNGSHKKVIQALHECTIASLKDKMSSDSDSIVVSHGDEE